MSTAASSSGATKLIFAAIRSAGCINSANLSGSSSSRRHCAPGWHRPRELTIALLACDGRGRLARGHDLDRQCQPSRAIAFAAIRAPHRRARCDDRFAIQTLRRRPPFGTADSSRFGAVSSCLDSVKIRLADVSVRGGPEGAPRGRFGEVDQQCRLEGRCGSADGSIWEAEPMEPN